MSTNAPVQLDALGGNAHSRPQSSPESFGDHERIERPGNLSDPTTSLAIRALTSA